MTDALPTPSETPADPHAGHGAWARGVIERHVEVEAQLAQAGLRLALAIEQGATQAAAQGQPVDKDAAMAFARVARGVRMSGLLQARLVRDLEQGQHRTEMEKVRAYKGALAAYDRACPDGEDEDPGPMEPEDWHKYRVQRILARIAEVEHDDDAVDRIVGEAGERLDDEDLYDDVLSRPIGELVSLICRDLKLNPDWDRLAAEPWARDEIDSGVPNSPFNRMERGPPPPLAGEGDPEGVERARTRRRLL